MKRKSKSENNMLSYYGFTKADQRKYPVVSSVLRQLTPERIKKEVEAIWKVELIHSLAIDRLRGGCVKVVS